MHAIWLTGMKQFLGDMTGLAIPSWVKNLPEDVPFDQVEEVISKTPCLQHRKPTKAEKAQEYGDENE